MKYEQPIPEIGKTYNCFDDGKIKRDRMYQVTITDIIPFEQADEELLELWNENVKDCDWLFDTTDYFIKFTSNERGEAENGIFARDTDNGWFGLGGLFCSGQLDVNGSLLQSIINYENKISNNTKSN